MTARPAIASARTLVVKVGTAVLTGGADRLDLDYLRAVAEQVARARDGGRRVVIVSSGAVGAGVGALGLPGRPADVAALQAAAAAGQPMLMSLWREAFTPVRVSAAQILLTRADFDSRERYLNIRNCIASLFDLGAVPIVNENDTVATEEIALGDNDVLAAKVAVAAMAEALIILTTGPGVLDDQDRVIAETGDAASLRRFIRPSKTTQGRGGMATKIESASIASRAGVPTVIAPGRPSDTLARILAGDSIGTCVLPAPPRHAGRRRWIALGATPAGALTVDDGAARALRERNASLLARGVVAVEGRFDVGDTVSIRDGAGGEFARGLVNMNSEEVRAVMGRQSSEFESILGRQSHEEVVHRDNLALNE